MVVLAEKMSVRSVGLPRIGAGLGGLPWDKVRLILERIGEETVLELSVFEK
jgi:O-acetyl-ADP-ribose deacetylase (regulator of RNase III)